MNHKRRRPKSTRAGCLLCKPHKHQGFNGSPKSDTRQGQRARLDEREQLEEFAEYLPFYPFLGPPP